MSNTIKVTEKEKAFLDKLVENLYAEEGFSDVSVEDMARSLGCSVDSAKGVLGSLVKKEFLWTDDSCSNGEFFIIYLHEEWWGLHPEWKAEYDYVGDKWTQVGVRTLPAELVVEAN